ncbi:FAD-dependent oxidoreductase [Rubritalea sp.]|uniref:FAD-dependent oxidoreductase n=1 Tax=Rubritalea sp. TaxID=2109375 RepID=UPI003EF63E50
MNPECTTEDQALEHEVLILGGGFGGIYAGKALGEKLNGQCESALVSENNYMVFQPMLAEVAGASISPRHVINPNRMLCRNLNVYRGKVSRIDLKNKEVTINTGHYTREVKIRYKHLVVALGAEIDLRRVPGMPEHGLLMQNAGDAMKLRSTAIARLEEANFVRNPELRRQLLTFVVVGGGYSGVETAGEILDMLLSLRKYYKQINKEDIRVTLVHSRDRILPTLSEKLSHYAAEKLQKRGLELCLNTRVKAVTSTKVFLNNGEVIPSNTVVCTIGNAPNALVRKMIQEFDLPTEQGRIKVDATMAVSGWDGLWALGDCAWMPMPNGKPYPPTAQFAMRQGTQLGKNIVSHYKGKPAQPFTFEGLGELASIGHRTAVANLMGVQVSGFLAWFLWRTIYLSKLPGLERRMRLTIDWTLDLFFPRDLNLVDTAETEVISEIHLEAGDTLFSTGDPAFSLYVVKSGKIELRNEKGETVRKLIAGDFFGERALVHKSGYLYDAIAAESTRMISVPGETILPVLQHSRRLRRVLAKTTAQASAESELETIIEQIPAFVCDKPLDQIMHSPIAALHQESTVSDALRLFKKKRYSIYPVINDEGQLVNVIDRDDFFDFMKHSGVTRTTCISHMENFHIPTCSSSDSVTNAVSEMIKSGRYKCLINNSDGELVGIVTMNDIMSAEQLLDTPNN